MSADNHVIIIPGLGNWVREHIWVLSSWKKLGIIPHVFDAKWRIEENGFQPKLEKAISLIDLITNKKARVSIIGNSAGSSFAINLYARRKKQINRVVINCGRVRDGDWPWLTFHQATKSSPSFRESVLRAQKLEKTFASNDRRKFLTLRPLFDEVVPPFTVPIRGARNEIVPSIEHIFSIALNMTLLKRRIIDFIRQ